MEFALRPHSTTPGKAIRRIDGVVQRDQHALTLLWRLHGDVDALVMPASASPRRTDGLWRSTCFELFVADEAGGYREFNFSPSGAWAAYAFSGRREGMVPLAIDTPPEVRVYDEGQYLSVRVRLAGIGAGPLRLSLTAVIEEKSGAFSYWALRHGADKPDFHDPDCFVLELPPAD